MSNIILNELEVLSRSASDVFTKLLGAAGKSSGDVGVTEIALASAVGSIRSLLVTSAMRVCVASAGHDYSCPKCADHLCRWGTIERPIVTSSGEGTFPSERYRCRSCSKDYYPWQIGQGLDGGNEFTLSARERIAEEGADGAYDRASVRLSRMGIPVSGSEVDQITLEVASWRKAEQEVVRDCACRLGKPLSIPLHKWDTWPDSLGAEDVLVFSVDGGMVRSNEVGSKGLDWFEVRSGLIGLVRKDRPFKKVCLGGLMSPDQLFENLRTQWLQSRLACNQKGDRSLRLLFVADGAEWIWARAGWYFPNCLQILDIYHGAAHVGAAARAAWGPDNAHAKRWSGGAMTWLLEPDGAKAIIRALLTKLRCSNAINPNDLQTEFRYLWRHRHRMNYHQWKEQGLTIGSGAIESCIKQTSTQRLNQPGMMWTKKNADLMMHVRSALLSDSLTLTVNRERQIRANRALQFSRTQPTLAKAV